MIENEECLNCRSLNTSVVDGKVFFCSECGVSFSRCEKCNDKYKTKEDPKATHLCENCRK